MKADPQLQGYFLQSTAEYFGCGIDAVTCADACGNGNPGFDSMDLGEEPYKTMSPSGRLALTDPDDYIFHFPDGNASIARLLVRSLIPSALPGHTMEDIVLAHCDYGKLDVPGSRVRIRLSAPRPGQAYGNPARRNRRGRLARRQRFTGPGRPPSSPASIMSCPT